LLLPTQELRDKHSKFGRFLHDQCVANTRDQHQF
jgi:hypothetical protein